MDRHGNNQEQDPHITGHRPVGEGEEENHHDKKSTTVMQKVKAKAMKIKDTLTNRGNGHEHDHDYNDLDKEDAEDEETVEDPEVHGAPMNESAAAMSAAHGQPESSPGKHGRSTAQHEDPLAPRENPDVFSSQTRVNDPVKSFTRPGQEESYKEEPRFNLGKTTAMGDVPHAPQNTPISPPGTYQNRDGTDPTRTFVHGQEGSIGQPKVNLEKPRGMEEDPDAPKERLDPSNNQSKVTDPTGEGGEEAGITPIRHSFGKMKVYDEPEAEQEPKLKPGSHDQFSPEPTAPKPITSPENPQSNPEVAKMTKSQEPYEQSNQSSYTEKISFATSAITDKATSAKNFVASKLGYGEKDNINTEGQHEGGDSTTANNKPTSAVDYGKKIATTVTEKLSPVYEKVAGAGTTVMSKMQGGTKTGTGSDNVQHDKGMSMKNYFAEKLKPGDEHRALSEVISDTLHRRKEEPAAGNKSMGKVTESEEMVKMSSTGDEKSEEKPSFVNSPGKGVVDKVKGAVGSWFGGTKSEESHQGNQQSLGSTHGTEGFASYASGGVEN